MIEDTNVTVNLIAVVFGAELSRPIEQDVKLKLLFALQDYCCCFLNVSSTVQIGDKVAFQIFGYFGFFF